MKEEDKINYDWITFHILGASIVEGSIFPEPLRLPDDYSANVRRRRSDEKDGLALSREIFKNITKHLRENIRREGATDNNDNLLQSKYRFESSDSVVGGDLDPIQEVLDKTSQWEKATLHKYFRIICCKEKCRDESVSEEVQETT